MGWARNTQRRVDSSFRVCRSATQMTMGQDPVPPVNIPLPTKIGSQMGGEFTNQPKWDPKTVLTHSQMFQSSYSDTPLKLGFQRSDLFTGPFVVPKVLAVYITNISGCDRVAPKGPVGSQWIRPQAYQGARNRATGCMLGGRLEGACLPIVGSPQMQPLFLRIMLTAD